MQANKLKIKEQTDQLAIQNHSKIQTIDSPPYQKIDVIMHAWNVQSSIVGTAFIK